MQKRPKTSFAPSISKKPAIAKEPTVVKIAKAVHGPNPNDLKPAWRISSLQMVDPYGWHQIEKAKLQEIQQKLALFESLTWNEILVKAQKQNHSVLRRDLCKAAQDHLVEIGLDDVDELVSLHLSGKERVWGIRSHNVLTVLWWDPDHAVCPSLKKHT